MRRSTSGHRPASLALGGLLPALALLLACAESTRPPAHELTNRQLSPELAQYLVGPLAFVATPAEIDQYLHLRDDAAAIAFIDTFWSQRDANGERAGNPLRELFNRRTQEADRRFAEAGILGRRTDRGAAYVLYGAPEKVDFQVNQRAGEPPIEVWTYPRDAEPGLDGKTPATTYRFIKRGDVTVLYHQPLIERDPIVRQSP